MDRYAEEISATKEDLVDLQQRFHTVRALSNRLRLLPLNDFSVPRLAKDLRTSILIASKRITDIDSDIQLHWEDNDEVQNALASGEIFFTDEQMATRRKLYDEVSVDLHARFYAIKREAKGESRDQEAAVEDRSFEAAGVDDYLASGVDGISEYPTNHEVLPSRLVVLNPFTMLARLVGEQKLLLLHDDLPAGFKATLNPGSDSVPPTPLVTDAEHQAMIEFQKSTDLELTSLGHQFDFVRAVHSRLSSLHSSDRGYEKISYKLRDLLSSAGKLLVSINDDLQSHWDVERRVVFTAGRIGNVSFSTKNAYWRRAMYDGLSLRFMRRVQEVQREVASEGKARRTLGLDDVPPGLSAYLSGSQATSSKAIEFVAEFPFTALSYDVDLSKPLMHVPRL